MRYPDTFPPIWVARQIREAASWGRLYSELSHNDGRDEAWFLAEDGLPTLPTPVATTSKIRSWDGRTAVVEHDGSCILVMRRTYYPGWHGSVDNGPTEPVLKVNGGLQGILLTGSKVSQVVVSYQPSNLRKTARISIGAAAAAVATLIVHAFQTWRDRRRQS